MKTSLGDLEIELWPKEAPKVGSHEQTAWPHGHSLALIMATLRSLPSQACRNFVQMCMEGYYDGTIFHRIIKDYLVQGGDPTGTGDGEGLHTGADHLCLLRLSFMSW